MTRTCVILLLCSIALIPGEARTAEPEAGERNAFEERRAKLLAMLSSPEMLKGDIDSGHYSYRRRWQHHHACLARGVNLKEANQYFAESNELEADEWPVLLYLRTYFAFKDSALSEAASKRLAGVIRDYKQNAPRSKSIERFGTAGNHSIVNFSMYLLSDQEFGAGAKHEIVRSKFIEWVRYQGRHGRDEVNSPHYLERSLLPLLNLYDFSEDPQLKLWAQMAIDQLLADFAVLSLDNVRGGPWCRAHHNHAPGVAEINDGRQDSFYVAGHQFFGHTACPAYIFTDQILSYGFVATTGYRPPEAVVELADRNRRGRYEFKSHQRSVNSTPSPGPTEWDMYYYITPSYSLGSLQDRVELDNHVTGSATGDFKNTQVWELTFADPLKILGPKRDLRVSTGENKKVVEERNPNTATMQYENVLFYKGAFMDYNGNLSAGGGAYASETAGDREFHFWRIQTPEGMVYAGITHFPAAAAGILEVGLPDNDRDFQTFQNDIKDNHSECREEGLRTTYVSNAGKRIAYDRGKATLDGKAWPLHGYPLYESPFIGSERGSGVIEIFGRHNRLRLDFRHAEKPTRTEGRMDRLPEKAEVR